MGVPTSQPTSLPTDPSGPGPPTVADARERGIDTVFLSASYGTGAVLLRVRDDKPLEVWSGEPGRTAY